MDKKYIFAIDGGTQSTKVVIFDFNGNIISQGKQTLRPAQAPKVGYVEHPDDDLWDSLVSASRLALDGFPGKVSEIAGIGLCTIRSCRVLLRNDGSLAYPVIDWMDTRAYGPFVFPVDDAAYATTTTGYMTHRLTGEFRDTMANCTNRQWPADMAAWDWSKDEDDFRKLNLKRSMMMEPQMPGSILGELTEEAAHALGLVKGIPVVATASDKAVEALGAGLAQSGNTGLVSLGTYITSMVCGKDYVKDAQNFWTNFASMPNKYLYESFGIYRGMWTVSWIRDILGEGPAKKAEELGISTEEYLNQQAAQVPAGSDGLMSVIEWLGGPRAPHKKGIMIGFDGRHTAAHMYRSILEGIALTMKNKFGAMCSELNIRPDKIIVSGGGSNSDLFMQIFADVFGIPALRNVMNGAAALGSAICAAVAVGVYPSYEDAAKNMVRIRDEFTPNLKNHELYNRMNEDAYKHISAATDEILRKTHSIFDV